MTAEAKRGLRVPRFRRRWFGRSYPFEVGIDPAEPRRKVFVADTNMTVAEAERFVTYVRGLIEEARRA